MAYVDQEAMSPRKAVAIVLVALLHVLIGYALISGLAYKVTKQVLKDTKVFDVEEPPPPPPPEPPPPPPDQPPQPAMPPPMVSPPPIVQTPVVNPPQVSTVTNAPPPVITTTAPNVPPAPVVAVAPPAPRPSMATGPRARGSEGDWVGEQDYPQRAITEEREGVTRITFTIGTDGRVTGCSVSGSSGSPDLDAATCAPFSRRARYTPAKDAAGTAISVQQSRSIRWQLPKD